MQAERSLRTAQHKYRATQWRDYFSNSIHNLAPCEALIVYACFRKLRSFLACIRLCIISCLRHSFSSPYHIKKNKFKTVTYICTKIGTIIEDCLNKVFCKNSINYYFYETENLKCEYKVI